MGVLYSMQLQFDSVEEVMKFVRKLRVDIQGPTSNCHPWLEPNSLENLLIRLVRDHDRISGIKLVRAATGMGLQESKELVDRVMPRKDF